MANSTTSITRAVIEQATNADAELAEKARALAHRAIDIARDYLDNGSPRMQLDVIKSIMPAIGRGLSEQGESGEMVLMREQLAELMRAVTGTSEVA